MLCVKLSIHVAGEYQHFSGSPLRNPCPDVSLARMFGAAFHLPRFPLAPTTLHGFPCALNTRLVKMTALKLSLSSRHLMAYPYLACGSAGSTLFPFVPSPIFCKSCWLSSQKSPMELFIDLIAKMGRSKLVISLHFGIYEVQDFQSNLLSRPAGSWCIQRLPLLETP